MEGSLAVESVLMANAVADFSFEVRVSGGLSAGDEQEAISRLAKILAPCSLEQCEGAAVDINVKPIDNSQLALFEPPADHEYRPFTGD